MNDKSTGTTVTMNDKPLSKTAQKRLAAQEFNTKNLARNTAENPAPLTLEVREELEALSKKAFNSTSRYATILRDGQVRPVTVTVTEYLPAVLDADGKELTAEKTVESQALETLDPAKKSAKLELVRHDVNSVRELMLAKIKRDDEIRALIAKLQAEQQAAKEKSELAQKVQQAIGGSVI